MFCYGIYSLIYKPHKSWYSWVINTLVGCVYTFGFILLCPQACPGAKPLVSAWPGTLNTCSSLASHVTSGRRCCTAHALLLRSLRLLHISLILWSFLLVLVSDIRIGYCVPSSCGAQLYLNYKLKSVAHLPWRQQMFKCVAPLYKPANVSVFF